MKKQKIDKRIADTSFNNFFYRKFPGDCFPNTKINNFYFNGRTGISWNNFSEKSIYFYTVFVEHAEAATGGVLLEKVLLEILQNSQENSYARVFSTKVAGLKPELY